MLRKISISSIALAALSTPALADITPQELWDHWVEKAAEQDVTLEAASAEETSDGLVLTDMTYGLEDGFSATTITIPTFTMTSTPDGGVESRIAGDLSGKVEFKDAADEALAEGTAEVPSFDISGTTNEFLALTTGDFGELTTKTTLDSASFTLIIKDTSGDGKELPLTFNFSGLTDTATNIDEDDRVNGTSEGSIEQLSVNVDVEDFDDLNKLKLNYTIDNLNYTMKANVPAVIDDRADLSVMLADGGSFDVNATADSQTTMFDMDANPSNPRQAPAKLKLEQTVGETSLKVKLDSSRADYAITSNDTSGSLEVAGMPEPFEYSLETSEMGVIAPVLASEEGQDLSILFNLQELSIGEAAWMLVDPQGELPHDPMSMKIDFDMVVQLMTNIADAMATPASAEPPMLPRNISINEVSLDALGATANVTGDVDTTNLNAPIGKVEGQFTGINGLLSSLTTLGLLPPEQVMGAQMMMSMFAKSTGEDSMESVLEFKEDGSILANGQRVK